MVWSYKASDINSLARTLLLFFPLLGLFFCLFGLLISKTHLHFVVNLEQVLDIFIIEIILIKAYLRSELFLVLLVKAGENIYQVKAGPLPVSVLVSQDVQLIF